MGIFNQEKALVGAFPMIVNSMIAKFSFEALVLAQSVPSYERQDRNL